MNRLGFVIENDVDPFDLNYFTSHEGTDCNGNRGFGFYCYCPSQGYNCECQYDDSFAPDEVRNTCYDHYGYNCQGDYVDGRANWCIDPNSEYTKLN